MTKKISTEVKNPPQLDTRHYEWIFSAAQEHFVEQIDKLEADNVRHKIMLQGASALQYHTKVLGPSSRKQRAEKITQNQQYLAQYRDIVDWLAMVRERVMEVSAEEFAEAFWATQRGKK